MKIRNKSFEIVEISNTLDLKTELQRRLQSISEYADIVNVNFLFRDCGNTYFLIIYEQEMEVDKK